MRDRTNEKWTKAEKEWKGYKRKLANFKKENVSLSKPPWEQNKKEVKEEKDEK